jgi:zona occludens toxin (predicted ATPase)
VDHLRQRLFSLPELPPVWSVGGLNADLDPEYQMLISNARAVVNQINHDLEQGHLDKKFAREISLLLEQTLLFFRTSFDDCQRVMSITTRWNLDNNNQKPVLEAACREGRWEEASNLFRDK